MEIKSKKAVGGGGGVVLLGYSLLETGLPRRALAAVGDFDTLLQILGDAVPIVAMIAGVASLAWGFGWVDFKRAPRRIELRTLLQIAEDKFGWDFGGDSLDPLDLQIGLVQAGVDKVIQYYGRNSQGSTLSYLYPLVPIKPKFFYDHDINLLTTDNNLQIQTTDVRSASNNGLRYIDLYVDRKQALRWLRRDAAQYKGTHPKGSHG